MAAFAAQMAPTTESSYTESVIDGLVASILDEGLDALERAEAVVALKSYLQADWNDVATQVGVSGRSLQVIAGMIRLKPAFQDSLRARRLGLRHGAALVRLGDKEPAAERLHEYLLANPDVDGEEALRIAGLLVRQPEMPPERARRQLAEDMRRRSLFRGMSDSDSGPNFAVWANLRSVTTALSSVDPATLSAAERAELNAELHHAAAAIERLQHELEATEG